MIEIVDEAPPKPKLDWQRLMLSAFLLVFFSSLFFSRIIHQKAMSDFMLSPFGADLMGIRYNGSYYKLTYTGDEYFCRGVFNCVKNICDMWKKPNTDYIGIMSMSACEGGGNFDQVSKAVSYEASYATCTWIVSTVLSLFLLLLYHIRLERFILIFYLVVRLSLPLAFLLNAILNKDPIGLPDYLAFWKWWELGSVTMAYLVESLIYLL